MIVGNKITMVVQRTTPTSTSFSASKDVFADTTYTYSGTLGAIAGTERFSSDKTTLFADYRFYTKYDSSALVTNKDRFRYGTRYFEIIFVNNVLEKNKDLVVTLKEVK